MSTGPEGQRSGRSCNWRAFIVKSSTQCFHTLQILSPSFLFRWLWKVRLQKVLETAKPSIPPLPAPLAELVSSTAPAPQPRVGLQGSCSFPQHPSQFLSAVSHYLKSVTDLPLIASSLRLMAFENMGYPQQAFLTAIPCLVQAGKQHTSGQMCCGAEGSRGTRAESRSCWQDLAQKQPQQPVLGSQQCWGHGATGESTDGHGNVCWGLRLAQSELPSQPMANPTHSTGIHPFNLPGPETWHVLTTLSLWGSTFWITHLKICSVLFIWYTFGCLWTHVSASSAT